MLHRGMILGLYCLLPLEGELSYWVKAIEAGFEDRASLGKIR